MDLDITRYPDFAALDLYCYRVAGVVGLMMTHVLGFTSDRCIPNALALGTAMQLTNILRDVAEDLAPRPGLPPAGRAGPVRRDRGGPGRRADE